jgi:hypothetical protein
MKKPIIIYFKRYLQMSAPKTAIITIMFNKLSGYDYSCSLSIILSYYFKSKGTYNKCRCLLNRLLIGWS